MSLRKLTRKSTLGFGRHAINTIQKVLDEDPTYIVWIYYNSSEITFFDDILEEVGLVGRFTIKKPSTNPDKFWDDEGRKVLVSKKLTEQEKGMNRKMRYHDKKQNIKKGELWESKASFKSKSMSNPTFFK
jgi:hypothetical protein